MNLGRDIVAEVLDSGDLKPYLNAGLTAGWVNGDNASVAIFEGVDKQAWLWLLEHHRKHKSVSPELFDRAFPPASYKLPKSVHSPAELIEAAQQEVTSILVGELSDDVVDLHDDGKLEEVIPLLETAVRRIRGGIKDTTETAESIANWDPRKAMDEELPMGVRLGLKPVDDVFYGLQPSMLGVIVGRQKSTKSTLMLHSALQAWKDEFDVLFYSVELDMRFLRERFYSLGAKVSPDRFRRGKLKDSERERVMRFHNEIRDDPVQFRVSHKRAMVTVDDLAAEVSRYKPHVVYVDGFYFMQDRMTKKSAGSDWQANENLAAELKTFAMDNGVVIITSTQSQEKQQGSKKSLGVEARTIMGGTGLLKAGDLVLGASKTDSGVYVNEIFNRFTPVPDVMVEWNWENMSVEVTEYEDPKEERDRQRDEFVRTMP